MPTYLEQLGQSAGMSAASGALGMGMGLLLEGHNDRRQLKQQGKLQAQEIAGQKEMTDYNMMKQLEMWKNTSYGAQMEQLKLAGLNPGLIYGMGGGSGGQTGQSTGNVTGGHAPAGGGEALAMGMQMMNMQLMKAQAEKLNAETENLKTTTGKTGAETTKIGEETKGIQLNNEFLSRSMEDRIDLINTDAARQIKELDIAEGKREEEARTRTSRVNIIIQDAIKKQLENAFIEQSTRESKARTGNIQADTAKIADERRMIEQKLRESDQLIKYWANQIALGWAGLDHKITIDGDMINGLDKDLGDKILENLPSVILGGKWVGSRTKPITGFKIQ